MRDSFAMRLRENSLAGLEALRIRLSPRWKIAGADPEARAMIPSQARGRSAAVAGVPGPWRFGPAAGRDRPWAIARAADPRI
ncbi:hypothetical protein [Paracoccus thiocyanatus]|uniref:hypothetical protein n=1 Tax=Paracoccus thiocyanatus TaxID=34006 RepID=UPI00122C1D60|nr:hypothetical protein [Paracoccus thiocyanatus]